MFIFISIYVYIYVFMYTRQPCKLPGPIAEEVCEGARPIEARADAERFQSRDTASVYMMVANRRPWLS